MLLSVLAIMSNFHIVINLGLKNVKMPNLMMICMETIVSKCCIYSKYKRCISYKQDMCFIYRIWYKIDSVIKHT